MSLDYMAEKTIIILSSIVNIPRGRGRDVYDHCMSTNNFNLLMNRNFISFKNYEESGYMLNLDLLTTLYKPCILYPMRNGMVGRSSHLRLVYFNVLHIRDQ